MWSVGTASGLLLSSWKHPTANVTSHSDMTAIPTMIRLKPIVAANAYLLCLMEEAEGSPRAPCCSPS